MAIATDQLLPQALPVVDILLRVLLIGNRNCDCCRVRVCSALLVRCLLRRTRALCGQREGKGMELQMLPFLVSFPSDSPRLPSKILLKLDTRVVKRMGRLRETNFN